MKFRKDMIITPVPPQDPSGWMIRGSLAEFLLLHVAEVRYMAMLGYTYTHGLELFDELPHDSSLSFKFISMVLECTGGGILVPLFINSIPVPLAHDAYPLVIGASFVLHQYLPILRHVAQLSPIIRACLIVLYETYRAHLVVEFTHAAAKVITPTEFHFAVFGPILCGAIAGCGYAFVPLNKGLDPIQKEGLNQAMISALIGAAFFHLFTGTSWSSGVLHANKKAHVVVSIFFILYHLWEEFSRPPEHEREATASHRAAKVESKKDR